MSRTRLSVFLAHARRRAFRQLREKGYIKHDLSPTREGQKRLHVCFPQPRAYPPRWDNTWYLVSFDIPERIAYKRRLLREALRALGFAKLHESLWISPFKVLWDVRAYAKKEQLDFYIMLAISKEVGTERSQALAARLFKLEELNQGYAALLRVVGSAPHNQEDIVSLIFQYYSLLTRDPFLPRPLLGDGWCGDKAHAWFKKISQTWRAE